MWLVISVADDFVEVLWLLDLDLEVGTGEGLWSISSYSVKNFSMDA